MYKLYYTVYSNLFIQI